MTAVYNIYGMLLLFICYLLNFMVISDYVLNNFHLEIEHIEYYSIYLFFSIITGLQMEFYYEVFPYCITFIIFCHLLLKKYLRTV